MSYLTIAKSVLDPSLRARIVASTCQEAWNNQTAFDTEYGKLVREYSSHADDMVWPVCIATDVAAAYEYALLVLNPDPGGDPTVITDGMILANIQGKWPADPVT